MIYFSKNLAKKSRALDKVTPSRTYFSMVRSPLDAGFYDPGISRGPPAAENYLLFASSLLVAALDTISTGTL
jgi:hypothetical protein